MGNTGAKYAATVWEGSTGVAWAALSAALLNADDGNAATVTSPAFDTGAVCRNAGLHDFSMGVPDGATIDGIEVTIQRATITAGTVHDSQLVLMKDGSNGVGTDQGTTTPYPTGGAYANAVYGGPADLWGTTWTAAEVNASGFGLKFNAISQANNQDFGVDFISVTVYYTESGVNPAALALALALTTPTLALSLALTPTVLGLAAVAATAPTLSLGYSLTPAPLAVPIVTVAPTIGLALGLSPAALAVAPALPAPTLAVTGGALMLTPEPLALALVRPAPSLALALGLAPATVAVATALPGADLAAPLSLTPAPAVLVLALPSPTLARVYQLAPVPVTLALGPVAPAVTLGALLLAPAPASLVLLLAAAVLDLGNLPAVKVLVLLASHALVAAELSDAAAVSASVDDWRRVAVAVCDGQEAR